MSKVTPLPTTYLSSGWMVKPKELGLEEAEIRLTQTLEAIRYDLKGIDSTHRLDNFLTPGMSEEVIQTIYETTLLEASNQEIPEYKALKNRAVSLPSTWKLFDTTDLLSEMALLEDQKIAGRISAQPNQEARLRHVTDLARFLNEIGAQKKNPHLQERARYLLYLNYTIAYRHGIYQDALDEMTMLFKAWL